MRRFADGKDSQRGAAAIELVLVFFPLIVLLFGIIEFSRVYSLQLRLQQAAREGAREIALHYDDPGWLPTDADAVIDGLLGAVVSGPNFTRTIVLCGTPTDDVTVTLRDQMDLAVPLPGSGLDAINVAARAQMPCEG